MNILIFILTALIIIFIVQSIQYIILVNANNIFRTELNKYKKECSDNIEAWKLGIEDYKKQISDLQDKLYHTSRESAEANYRIVLEKEKAKKKK